MTAARGGGGPSAAAAAGDDDDDDNDDVVIVSDGEGSAGQGPSRVHRAGPAFDGHGPGPGPLPAAQLRASRLQPQGQRQPTAGARPGGPASASGPLVGAHDTYVLDGCSCTHTIGALAQQLRPCTDAQRVQSMSALELLLTLSCPNTGCGAPLSSRDVRLLLGAAAVQHVYSAVGAALQAAVDGAGAGAAATTAGSDPGAPAVPLAPSCSNCHTALVPAAAFGAVPSAAAVAAGCSAAAVGGRPSGGAAPAALSDAQLKAALAARKVPVPRGSASAGQLSGLLREAAGPDCAWLCVHCPRTLRSAEAPSAPRVAALQRQAKTAAHALSLLQQVRALLLTGRCPAPAPGLGAAAEEAAAGEQAASWARQAGSARRRLRRSGPGPSAREGTASCRYCFWRHAVPPWIILNDHVPRLVAGCCACCGNGACRGGQGERRWAIIHPGVAVVAAPHHDDDDGQQLCAASGPDCPCHAPAQRCDQPTPGGTAGGAGEGGAGKGSHQAPGGRAKAKPKPNKAKAGAAGGGGGGTWAKGVGYGGGPGGQVRAWGGGEGSRKGVWWRSGGNAGARGLRNAAVTQAGWPGRGSLGSSLHNSLLHEWGLPHPVGPARPTRGPRLRAGGRALPPPATPCPYPLALLRRRLRR